MATIEQAPANGARTAPKAAVPETELVRETPTSVFHRTHEQMYARYDAELTFFDKIMGGTPKSADLIEGWIRAKAGVKDDQEVRRMVVRSLIQQGMEVPGSIGDLARSAGDEDELLIALAHTEIADVDYEMIKVAAEAIAAEQQTTGFKRDENGLYIESRQVKAMIREAVNIGFAGDRWGATRKGPRAFTAERVFVTPDHISLGAAAPTDTERVIGHITDQAGKRSTVGYHEFVERAVISFQVEVLDDAIQRDQWERMWVIAERGGLGALRSQGFGVFAVTRWDLVNEVKPRAKTGAVAPPN